MGLDTQGVPNGANTLKQHNDYSSTESQQTWDDGLILIGAPKSQPHSYSSNSNVPRFLYHRATNGTFGDFVTIDTEVTSAQPYTAYYGFMTPTALAVSETQTLTFSGYGTAPSAVRIPNRVSESDNFLLALLKDGVQKDMVGLYFNPNASAAYNRQKDAVKMGTTGIDILWSEMTSGAFSYYTQPFVGDTMRFELRVNSGSTGSYLLQPVGSLPEGYRLYVQWEGKSTQHPLTAQGYAIGRRGDLTLPLYIVKESGSETAVVAPELAGVQWYQKDDQLTIDGLAEGAVVTVWSVAGVCLAKVTSEGGRVVVNGVLPGVYVVQILQHQQHQSFKVLLR